MNLHHLLLGLVLEQILIKVFINFLPYNWRQSIDFKNSDQVLKDINLDDEYNMVFGNKSKTMPGNSRLLKSICHII